MTVLAGEPPARCSCGHAKQLHGDRALTACLGLLVPITAIKPEAKPGPLVALLGHGCDAEGFSRFYTPKGSVTLKVNELRRVIIPYVTGNWPQDPRIYIDIEVYPCTCLGWDPQKGSAS